MKKDNKHPCKNCISFPVCRNKVKSSDIVLILKITCALFNKYIGIDPNRKFYLRKIKTLKLFGFDYKNRYCYLFKLWRDNE